MVRKIISLLLLVAISCTLSVGCAEQIVPYADSEFMSAYISISVDKDATFVGKTYEKKSAISVTACSLEKKTGPNTWSFVCSLTPPPDVCENTHAYSAMANYSKDIGTGTFRIKATFDADGHTITRYSNERTFN